MENVPAGPENCTRVEALPASPVPLMVTKTSTSPAVKLGGATAVIVSADAVSANRPSAAIAVLMLPLISRISRMALCPQSRMLSTHGEIERRESVLIRCRGDMSVYLLLALAFGTMSGAVATPAARPAPVFVTRRASGASRQLVRNARVVTPQRSINRFLPAPHTLVRCEAPLTGAASPRAPALR